MIARQHAPVALDAALSAERARLVRLCASLAGDWSAAEDLAQETLFEALRALDRLRDADGLVPWLSAIARNVCLRWRRERALDLAHLAPTTAADASGSDDAAPDLLDQLPAATGEASVLVERAELASLLDRALALLPADTRDALVGAYIHDLPQAELAARLGLTAGALRVRLHRGKLSLCRVLTTGLRADALALGLALPGDPDTASSAWRDTRIWCPFCGAHRLAVWMDPETGEYAFRCAGACQDGIHLVGAGRDPELLGLLSSPKSILTRHCLAAGAHYRRVLAGIPWRCPRCGAHLHVHHIGHDQPPHPILALGISLTCPRCDLLDDINSPWHLSIDTEAAQHFWRRHPRMRFLPARPVELGGRPAVLTSMQSLESPDRLDIISARDTHEVLRLDGAVS